MAPDTASERRHSFSSISLAKEEATIDGNGTAPATPKTRTGLNKKRFWIPAIAVYLATVTGASYGSYRLGWNNAWDDAVEVMRDWIPIRPINGYLTDVDGSHWNFNKQGNLVSVSYVDKKGEEIVMNRAPTPDNPFSTGYVAVPNTYTYPPPPTKTPSTTLTKRKRAWVEARATDVPVVEEVVEEVVDVVSGSESDNDGPAVEVVVEEVSTSDSDSEADVVEIVEEQSDEGSASETELVIEDADPELVEVHDPTPDVVEIDDPTPDLVEVSDSEPVVVEVHDPPPDTVVLEDSEPETVLEEVEVTDLSGSGSDSELHKRGVVGGTRQRDKYGDLPPPVAPGGYDPYAIGDEPYAYAGNGDRYLVHGVRAREKVAPQYTRWFEIPAGPDAHLVNPTTNGGLRIYDPYVPRPTGRIWDAPIPDAGGYLPKASFRPDETTTSTNIYGELNSTPTPAPAPAVGHHFHVVPQLLRSTGRSFQTQLSKQPVSSQQQIPTPAPAPAAVSASATLVSAVPAPAVVTPVPAVASVSVDAVKGSVAVSVSLATPATAAGSASYSVLQGSASAPASASASANAQKAAPAPAAGSAAAPAAAAKDNGPDKDHYVVTLTLPRGVIATPAPVGPPAL